VWGIDGDNNATSPELYRSSTGFLSPQLFLRCGFGLFLCLDKGRNASESSLFRRNVVSIVHMVILEIEEEGEQKKRYEVKCQRQRVGSSAVSTERGPIATWRGVLQSLIGSERIGSILQTCPRPTFIRFSAVPVGSNESAYPGAEKETKQNRES
jgi:hypothetical protein